MFSVECIIPGCSVSVSFRCAHLKIVILESDPAAQFHHVDFRSFVLSGE